jgi:hypothetical protein
MEWHWRLIPHERVQDWGLPVWTRTQELELHPQIWRATAVTIRAVECAGCPIITPFLWAHKNSPVPSTAASALKMRLCFSETSISTYESTRRNNPQQQRHPHRLEDLKAHISYYPSVDFAGRTARELWRTSQRFSLADSISQWLSTLTYHLGHEQ